MKVVYWIRTALTAFVFLSGGVFDILQPGFLMEGMLKLGYPPYFCTILGVWKVLGGIVVLLPRLPRLKEWAYAGMLFDLTGASASHAFSSRCFTASRPRVGTFRPRTGRVTWFLATSTPPAACRSARTTHCPCSGIGSKRG